MHNASTNQTQPYKRTSMLDEHVRARSDMLKSICVFFFLKTCGRHVLPATLKCARCVGCVSRLLCKCCGRDSSPALPVHQFCVFCFLRGPPKMYCWVWLHYACGNRTRKKECGRHVLPTTLKCARCVGCVSRLLCKCCGRDYSPALLVHQICFFVSIEGLQTCTVGCGNLTRVAAKQKRNCKKK